MTDDERQPVRRGRSDKKRAAILAAAEALFLTNGYDRTSADAIALSAGVSKRTVYDHFGDKERLYAAVVAQATAGLMATLTAAVEQELPQGCDPGPALLTFARLVAAQAFGSSEYALFRKLLAAAGPARTASADEDPAALLASRIEAFHRAGTLHAPAAGRATEHFVALTFLIALDSLERRPDAAELDQILVDGVDAFMRAYAPRPGELR